MHKRSLVYISLIIVFIFFSACESKKTPLKIGIDDWPPCQLWYVAQEKGFFDNTEVEIIKFSNWSDSLSSFSLGKTDMTHSTLFNALYYKPKGDPAEVILFSDLPIKMDGLVAKKSINSISELKGKKIAVELGTDEHFFLYKALKNSGIKDNEVTIIPSTNKGAVDLFLSGEVDACFVYEPYLSTTTASGNILVYVDDMGGYVDVLIANNNSLKNRKKDFNTLVNAWYKSLAFVKEHPEEAYSMMAAKTGMSVDEFKVFYESFVFYDLSENIQMFRSEGIEKDLNNMNNFLFESGLLDKRIDIRTIYTPNIVEKAGKYL